jgi:hypothetical protein
MEETVTFCVEKGEKMRIYILSPSQSQIRPSMDEKNSIYSFLLWFSEDVAVCDAIEVGGFELDPRISGGDLVNHLEATDEKGMRLREKRNFIKTRLMLEVEFDGLAPVPKRNVSCEAAPQRHVRAEVGFGTLTGLFQVRKPEITLI